MRVWLPEMPWAGYLIDYLFEFGPVKADAPLEPVDLIAIQALLGVQFKPWESRLLLRLSREYKGEMHAATKRNAPPPWAEAAMQWNRANSEMERNINAFIGVPRNGRSQ